MLAHFMVQYNCCLKIFFKIFCLLKAANQHATIGGDINMGYDNSFTMQG